MKIQHHHNGSYHKHDLGNKTSASDAFNHYGKSMIEDLDHHLHLHDQILEDEFEKFETQENEALAQSGWFSMSRDDGGPSSLSETLFSYPMLYSSDIAMWCFVFSVPLFSFIVLLPSFRKKHALSVLVVILCLLSGLTIVCSYVSSSWLVGETEVIMPIIPSGPPIKSYVGIWVGLWHANLTYVTPNIYINHLVTWNNRAGLMSIHKTALSEGWPLALLSLTAELSGEGIAWRGVLGDGLYYAGSIASYPMMAALYSWAVWVIIFVISPEIIYQPLMITGVLTTVSVTLFLVLALVYLPSNVLICGTLLKLKLGWAWWLLGCLSIVLESIGGVLIVYDYMYPGKVAAMFKVDFYTKIEDLAEAPETLFAYESSTETYSQIYPLSLSYLWYGNKNPSTETLLSKSNTYAEINVNSKEINVDDDVKTTDVVYDDESSRYKTFKRTTLSNKESQLLAIERLNHTFQKSTSMTSLRKRTPPEKSPSKKTSSEPTLNQTPSFATIRRGKTMPRQISVPTIVPQVSPRLSAERSHKRSLSRIHSKFRPIYSPRKPSMVSLVSLPKLELEEFSDNITQL